MTLDEDKINLSLSDDFLANLKVSDFTLSSCPKSEYAKLKHFINRYEWLGKMSPYPTHYYIATYKDILGGVIILDQPTVFSKLLGEEKVLVKKEDCIERLISRGACASWTPKCLASCLLMYAIRDMVKNTQYRIFSAYSDPEAKELGTIYQACNFYYMGNRFGAKKQFYYNNHWTSDRYFRSRALYKTIAKKNGIQWEPQWQNKDSIRWEKMPIETTNFIKNTSKQILQSCPSRDVSSKHKYIYVLGTNKTETNRLRELFVKNNKVYPYPKVRGE